MTTILNPVTLLIGSREAPSIKIIYFLERILSSAVTIIRSAVRRVSLLVMSPLGAHLAGRNVKIGTHDGTFHADETLACAMLKMVPR